MRRELTSISIVILILSCLSLAIASSALAARKKVIIGYTSPPGKWDEDDIAARGGKVKYRYHIVPAIAAEIDEAEADKIKKKPKVKYVEPDYEVQTARTVPDDLQPGLWGLDNTGQSGGTPDADIDAPEAWDIQTGSSSVVIAVIDTGVDYNHQDLAANIWTNHGEIPGNGVDDDGNGYIDDIHGYDFCSGDGDPMDDAYHGTHCAGTIAAVGNNGVGVVGVNWTARIMALKFLSSSGHGDTSDAVAAIEYVIAMRERGVPVVAMSNSWGGCGYSEALENAITAADQAGMLVIAAAGNYHNDNDVAPFYPASYDVPNVISVAATDHNDELAAFSNYGATSVDLAAPGVSILSTILGGDYAYKSGTSMATPHVSGVAGLVKAQLPGATHLEIKGYILGSVDPIATLAGKMLTGGRLNACGALGGLPEPPQPPTGLTAATGSMQMNLNWNDNTEPELTGYNVYRSTTSGEHYSRIGTAHASEYADTGVDGATTYYYVVTAIVDFTVESGYSNEASATTPPAVPTGLVATAGDQQVTLDWDDNTGSVIYNVYRSTVSGGGYGLIAAALPVSEYTDVTVLNGITYYYVVTAEGTLTGEESDPSNEVSATPADVTSPAKVTGLEVATVSSSSLNLTWDANTEPDLSHYNVYRSSASGGPYSLIASPTTNSYLDTGLEPSTTYYYVVGAENTSGAEGPLSDEASGTTSDPVDRIMYVESMTFSSKVAGKNKFLYIDVEVVDENARPLSDVKVDVLLVRDMDGTWNFSDNTRYNGIVRFTQRKAKVGRYTATVTDLSLSGRTWDSGKGVTSGSCELRSDGTVIQGTALTSPLISSMLLQNNPNPFNPETWIPYLLAKPERVIIRIYNATGRLVKTLDLGDKAAGAYISKEKAAYWDGSNESGEEVSSGIYFYTMEAGSFRATRKLLVIR